LFSIFVYSIVSKVLISSRLGLGLKFNLNTVLFIYAYKTLVKLIKRFKAIYLLEVIV